MLTLLHEVPAAAIATAMVLGLLVGSFLNVVIHRVPVMLERDWERQAAETLGQRVPEHERFDLMFPGSRCPACGHALGALENIPLVSWLVQRARCRACGTRIPVRYPLVELATGVLFALAIARFGATAAGLAAAVFTGFLIALAFIDLDTQLLPDSLTLPLLWLGLLFNLRGGFASLEAAVIGAVAGYLLLWAVYWAFRIATGKEGMGYGDFKLLAALGAWFGWTALPAIVLLASVVGAIVGLALMAFARHGRETPIPFGPYLAGAGLLALYFRQPLEALYGLG